MYRTSANRWKVLLSTFYLVLTNHRQLIAQIPCLQPSKLFQPILAKKSLSTNDHVFNLSQFLFKKCEHLYFSIDQTINEQTNGRSSTKFPGCLVIFTSLLCMAKSNMATTMLLLFFLLFFACRPVAQTTDILTNQSKLFELFNTCKQVPCVLGHIKILMMHFFLDFICVKMHDFCVNAISV